MKSYNDSQVIPTSKHLCLHMVPVEEFVGVANYRWAWPWHVHIKTVPNTVPLRTINPGLGSEMWFVALFILGASGKLESTQSHSLHCC